MGNYIPGSLSPHQEQTQETEPSSVSQPVENSTIPAIVAANASDNLSIEQLQAKYGKDFEKVLKKIIYYLERYCIINDPVKKQNEITSLANLALNKELLMARYFSINALKRYGYEATCNSEKKSEKNHLKVFFTLSDIETWRHSPYFARVLLTPIEPPCGYVHSALQIGPWLFHWVDSSMIFIEPANSAKSILSLAVEKTIPMNDSATFEKIIDKIIHWNAKVDYSALDNNCQKFTFDLLYTLECHDEVKGCIGEYFKGIKSLGLIECKHLNPFTNKLVKFMNHKQLDEYMIEILTVFAQQKNLSLDDKYEIVKQFANEYQQDFALLKAFDRGYWMRYNKYKGSETTLREKVEKFKLKRQTSGKLNEEEAKQEANCLDKLKIFEDSTCLCKDHLIQCPFGDPTATLSQPQPIHL